jgi:hypothetical protein
MFVVSCHVDLEEGGGEDDEVEEKRGTRDWIFKVLNERFWGL